MQYEYFVYFLSVCLAVFALFVLAVGLYACEGALVFLGFLGFFLCGNVAVNRLFG